MRSSPSMSVAPPADDAEASRLMDVLAPVFNFPRAYGERYIAGVGRENFRIVRAGASMAGGLALLPMGQFFGGRSVPMMGVAVVGIAPEHRAKGTATFLMQHAVREMRSGAWPISVLYPATFALYRRAGYELAGSRFEIRLALSSLDARDRSLGVQRLSGDRGAELARAAYQRRAPMSPGNLDRSKFLWHRITDPRGEAALGFGVAGPSREALDAYVYYVQKESPDAVYSLHATDLVALTREAGSRLLSFLADHRSMADQIVYNGCGEDILVRLAPRRGAKVRLLDHWMLRIVDVGAALMARGYAPGLSGEVHLDVQDDLIVENNGRYVLELSNGQAAVSAGGNGDLVIDIRGLASLYTGFASPHDLISSGHLELASHARRGDASLAGAAAAFAGPSPWMPEMF